MATVQPIIMATAECNGQLIQAEVYGGPHAGSLVIRDQHGQLITLNMQRFSALMAALNSVERQLNDLESEAV